MTKEAGPAPATKRDKADHRPRQSSEGRRARANVGLVLSGGGARAAYQVGALSGVAEILGDTTCPFRIITGLSAGAINGVALASAADDFQDAVLRLARTWMSLTPDKVYRTDVTALATLGARWAKDLTTGGLLGPSRSNHILATDPLRRILTRELDMDRLPQHVASGLLRAVAISATNYLTGSTVTFFDGASGLEPWVHRAHVAVRDLLRVDHVMASAAIPIFFPPVCVDGKPYGDGGIRLATPLYPAIHLGAEKLFAIGIRHRRSPDFTMALNRARCAQSVSVSEIAGVLLNAYFLDSLDDDHDRLERLNRTLAAVPPAERAKLGEPLRIIPAFVLQPSRDLGQLARDQYRRFPAVLRHLLRGIGASDDAGWDLLSYLAFLPAYVSKLMELGRDDALGRRAEIETFFATPRLEAAPPSVMPTRLA